MPARGAGRPSQAKKRLNLLDLVGAPEEAERDSTSIRGVMTQFQDYIPGIIDTLGLAAQPTRNQDGSVTPGDLDAAKKALDFLGRVMSMDKGSSRGADMLAKLAGLRKERNKIGQDDSIDLPSEG